MGCIERNGLNSQLFVLVLGISLGLFRHCDAQFHPDHPRVVAMVNKGIQYLEKTSGQGIFQAGSRLMVGYTIYKVTGDADHPKVRAGLEEAVKVIRAANAGSRGTHIVYEASVAAMFLATVNPEQYRVPLEVARDWFLRIQRQQGGYGYLDGDLSGKGDTSQIQYVMLATWSLDQVGISMPASSTEACIRFLQATQDPSGAWGYQGVVPNGQMLVQQDRVSKSLGTAGICGFLLGCDQLKLFGSRTKDPDGIPKAFERIDNIVRARGEAKPTLKKDDIDETMNRAFRYQENSPPQGSDWYFYWRYGQERYESLREVVEGQQQKSPRWYNQGVEELARTQVQDGSWPSGIGSSPDVDTCFAILFLIRSTQKAIGKLDEGVAFGGYELPSDLSTVRMVGDKIVSDKDTSVESLLSLMEDEKNYVGEGMLPNNLLLSRDPKERAQQVARLSRVLDSDNAIARRLAARLLGRSEDLSVVPDLIYALSDSDPDVPKLAEESLRLLSRHLEVVHVRQKPTEEQRSAAISYWKNWYLGVKPDHVFLDR